MKGVIEWFNEIKGFGFIDTEKGSVFFHVSDIKNKQFTPTKGESVLFDIIPTEKGNKAINIQSSLTTNKFIAFGQKRIRLSSIKSYTIENDSENYLCSIKYYEHVIQGLKEGRSFTHTGNIESNTYERDKLIKSMNYSFAVHGNLEVLIVEIYGQKYPEVFYNGDRGFDIYSKYKELVDLT